MSDSISLPILDELVKEAKNVGGVPTIAIQHLREDTYYFIKKLSEIGFDPITISGIEYSTIDAVFKKLQADGYAIQNPPNKDLFDPKYWDNEVGQFIKECENKDKPYIILEDGGYIGQTFHNERTQYLKKCIGSVEQTANGLWKYQALEKSGRLTIPVFTVADSDLKDLAEAPEVGLAIAKSIETELDKLSDSLNYKNVFVIGFGSIGREVALALQTRNADVMIYDLDSIKMMEATIRGLTVVDKVTGLEQADIIVGCTGKKCLEPKDYEKIKDRMILASGTSKKVEFDIDWMSKHSSNRRDVGNSIEFEINGKVITVLAKGGPVNFLSNVSVSPQTIDIIISEMFLCMLRIFQGGLENRVYTITQEDEKKISDLWLKHHKGIQP